MQTVEQRLVDRGIVIPVPTAPVASYLPFVRHGDIVHISGQVSADASGGIRGTVGDDLDLAAGQAAARICALNLLAQMRSACEGDLDRIVAVLKLGGFVQTGPSFSEIPQVMNGCSDLMVDIFGDAGRHSRSAVGVYRLPMNFAVEVDAVIAIR